MLLILPQNEDAPVPINENVILAKDKIGQCILGSFLLPFHNVAQGWAAMVIKTAPEFSVHSINQFPKGNQQ